MAAALHLALVSVVVEAAASGRSPPAPDPAPAADYQRMTLYTVRDAKARGALCTDGSPARYYYRNCTANGELELTVPYLHNITCTKCTTSASARWSKCAMQPKAVRALRSVEIATTTPAWKAN